MNQIAFAQPDVGIKEPFSRKDVKIWSRLCLKHHISWAQILTFYLFYFILFLLP